MQFNRNRMSKLAGLLTESKEDEEVSEAEECDESEDIDESEECDESEDIDEAEECDESDEMKENYDIRKVIRNEIKRSLRERNSNSSRYASGQIFGKSSKNNGTVTMGFPGIGFKR